jgi:hypothetical protein
MHEPTASLDFGNQVKVLGQVKQFAARGLGVVLSTHDPDHAFATATRALLLHDKGLIADGPPGEVLTPKNCAVSAAYRFRLKSLRGEVLFARQNILAEAEGPGMPALFRVPRLLGDVVAGVEAIVAHDLLAIGTEDKRGRVVGTSGGTLHDDDPVSMAGHGMPS